MPPEPEPSRFSNWSSEGSPPVRPSPPSAHDVQTEPQNSTQNQLNVPTAGATRSEMIEVGTSERVTIASQTEPLRESQDIPARPIRSDLMSNEENVTIIPPIQIGSARSSLHTDDVALTRIAPRESSAHDDLFRDSHIRTQDVNIEGISSICPVSSSVTRGIRQVVLDNRGHGSSYQNEGLQPPRASTAHRRDSSESSDVDRFPRGRGHANERGRPPERERYPSRDRRPPRRRGMPSNRRPPDGPPREPSDGVGPPYRGLSDRGGLPNRGGLPDDGGPLIMEDPLVMEDHLMKMEDRQDVQIEEEPKDQEDLLDQ